jgi:nucleotide-binding universal stress UspA family protein
MAKAIMVPLDGSTFAEHAIPAALGVAEASDAHLHLVQVHELPFVPTSPELMVAYDAGQDERLRAQEREYLLGIANRLADQRGLSVRTELVDGQPPVALATYARDADIDLVVMTTHGRSGLSRAWLGSVADGVVRRSGVPVLLLRPHADEAELEQPVRPQHVLIPLDGSALSRGVVDAAVSLGALSKARYTLVRVVLPVPLIRRSLDTDLDPFHEQNLEEAKADLERAAAPLRERGFDVEIAAVSGAVPAATILEFAQERVVDLIAMATHGRGGWSRIALGSVADKVLRGASVPVLVVRPGPSNHETRATQDAEEPTNA